MADDPPTEPPQEQLAPVDWLQQRLRRAAERRRSTEIMTLAIVAASAIVLTAGAYGLADWLVGFPRTVRLCMTAAAAAAGLIALRRHAPRWVPRRMSTDDMARLAEDVQERAGRRVHSRLVAAIEFGERPAIPGDTGLKNRVIGEARTDCADPAGLRLHEARHVRLAARLGAAAGVVLLLVLACCPSTAYIFLCRAGGARLGYPTATRIVRVVWRAATLARQNYPVSVTVAGRIPPSGVLRVRVGGRRGYELPLLPADAPGTFSAVVPAPEKAFTFGFRLGDCTSEHYDVRVAEPMYVKSGRVRVVPPAYTGQPAVTAALGSLTVPEDSRLRFEIVPDRDARRVSLVLDGHPLPLQRGDGDAWSVTFTATNSAGYEIAMADPYGMENADRLKRSLVVTPDAPPALEVRQPKPDAFISVASLVPFEVQARDDYGLVRLNVAYEVTRRLNDKDVVLRRGVVALEHPALTGRVDDVEQIVRAADLTLAPGQRVVFRVTASDNRPGRANVGQAPDIGLQVVEPDELKRVLEAELAQAAALIRKLRDSENQQSAAIFQRLAAESGGRP